MDEDLEEPEDDDPFYEGKSKILSQNMKDVMGEDWWSDDDWDKKQALRTKFANSDDEDNMAGDKGMH